MTRLAMLGLLGTLGACGWPSPQKDPGPTTPLKDTGSGSDSRSTGEDSAPPGDTGAGDSAPTDTHGTTDSAFDDTGSSGACVLTPGYYRYDPDTLAVPKGSTCGEDLTLAILYGYFIGITFASTDTGMTVTYEGMSLAPTCTLEADCSFACSREAGTANLSFLGLGADLDYAFTTSGRAVDAATITGVHGVELGCVGSTSDCEELDGLIGVTLPCTGDVTWTAAL